MSQDTAGTVTLSNGKTIGFTEPQEKDYTLWDNLVRCMYLSEVAREMAENGHTAEDAERFAEGAITDWVRDAISDLTPSM